MSSITTMITASTALLILLTTPISARHIHRQSSHRHLRRHVVPNVPDSSVTTPSLPVITAGDAAVEDIQDIQSGLSDLPRNLLAFVQAVEQRLSEVEDVLQSLVSSSSQPTSTLAGKDAATSSATGWSMFLPPPPKTVASIPIAVSSESSSMALLRTTAIIGVPASSAPTTTFSEIENTYTSRVTSTRTRTSTSTISIPPATGTGTPYQPSNGTVTITSLPTATGAVYPITLPLNHTFVTKSRAATTPPTVV
ncbi:hypothetical protein DOTSEDRAFT_52076 [Dothistroma septosporum NZE10]|uniref:Uncharacterized protein n=1 Tax=Dothistroma septosporum (strain NZE10 / CBS 128990) TaxID=675120 RepID=N1PWB4_DOTSN|nr:hypothetical protein DOTSEDRAFT_52076 [Dothistroma septosporum NZE10]